MNRYPLFRYRDHDTLLHRADPRIKSAAFLLFNLVLAVAGLPGVALAAAALVAGYAASREALVPPLVAGWPVLLLGAVVVLTRGTSLGAGRPELPAAAVGPILFYRRGLVTGALFALRLAAALYAAHLFVATTPVRDLRQVARWLFGRLLPDGAARLSVMIGLTLSFFPLLSEKTALAAEALTSRGLSPARHPVRYLTRLTVTVLQSLFYASAETTAALESRGFDLHADPPRFAPLRAQDAGRRAASAVCAATALVVTAGIFL